MLSKQTSQAEGFNWKLLRRSFLLPYVSYITQTGHTGWLVMFLADTGQSYVHVDQGVLILAVRERAGKEVISCKLASAAAAEAHYSLQLPVVEEKVDRPYGSFLQKWISVRVWVIAVDVTLSDFDNLINSFSHTVQERTAIIFCSP